MLLSRNVEPGPRCPAFPVFFRAVEAVLSIGAGPVVVDEDNDNVPVPIPIPVPVPAVAVIVDPDPDPNPGPDPEPILDCSGDCCEYCDIKPGLLAIASFEDLIFE
ncbi:hypothetical protein PHYBLDRAFT_158541 [Phycomyces blakesleeanus NRRL 1555(-)]|uniref:Uncharacterized protein n=1 Tax=Phycomyces blakesleeanus (strain ATCC 8743b / DSM 1359 / FGSC 10004 / NBRC 33097 / NRRL 1555) TaxID=763407 RepID=A0A162UB67_PHYB8|nr:hypothetical protein PHYBLDRAFT_158541 [Phycomyces blakesleeanus NRRL 1555(-)]OAD74922.1 hypothetical protein PHYBLDRAFT_158541 [Phycomyces blakesleeanus NRRL 1555(-)]|eukprot:XP_018292962.1 hypothetical protein PHYBLDRAFT_158541 [Phycomyces blakesleeanus NRRL 1555(-)]